MFRVLKPNHKPSAQYCHIVKFKHREMLSFNIISTSIYSVDWVAMTVTFWVQISKWPLNKFIIWYVYIPFYFTWTNALCHTIQAVHFMLFLLRIKTWFRFQLLQKDKKKKKKNLQGACREIITTRFTIQASQRSKICFGKMNRHSHEHRNISLSEHQVLHI